MANARTLEVQAALAIQAILQPGETLLWQGRPERSRPLLSTQRFAATVSLLLGSGLLLLTFLFRDENGGLREALAAPGLVALVFGGFMLLKGSRWVFGALRHHGYAVTDRRALLVRLGRNGPKVEEYGPALIAYVHVYPIADSVADVIFREGPNLGGMPDPRRSDGREINPIGFKAIRDSEPAADALRVLRASARLASPSTSWDASRAAKSASDRRP